MTTKQPAKQQKEKKAKTEIEKVQFVNTTPKGDKKDLSGEMLPAYHPQAVEAAWYEWWEQCGYFTPDNKSTKERFVIMLPPPNVTGSLHLGHTLTGAIQDTLVRWNRMCGKNVLYLPGVDHAGIATQVVVEKKLQAEQKLSRHDLGREKFISKVWEWKEVYGSKIVNQLRRTGSSLDWSRECFTMDPKLSKAVTEAFVRLYEQGNIYRATKLVNWCCALRTAISNIEVETENVKAARLSVPQHGEKKYDFGYIWSFAYKVENSEEEIIVATTRPETMLGDTAVAVHPDDPRYKHLHGKFVVHPFMNRKIPIVCDSKLVDMKLGTGAVKITPAHDHNDFECGKRHNLPLINIFNDDGTVNENGGEFQGMKRYDARNAVLKKLEEAKLFRERKEHELALGFCSRSNDVIEPMMKPQWFMDCTKFANQGLEAAKSGKLKILPEKEVNTWERWLGNIQDWCISRQLWWGHRIPAYFVTVKGQQAGDRNDDKYWVVGRTEEEAKKNAATKFQVSVEDISLEQDEDVLDTWFSSGLFPFSTLGWPEETEDLKAFYPGTLLETGVDILFFWVARMVMMGLALTGELPFSDVYLHSIVRDKFGRKMSKSLGNVVDPIDVIEGVTLEQLYEKLKQGNLPEKEIEKAHKGQKEQFPTGIPECGTDALRFALLNYCSQQNINLDILRVFGYRTFCNKLWNATRFALTNLTGFTLANIDELPQPNSQSYSFADLWILSRLNHAIKEANDALAQYDFGRYTTTLYDFFLYELCDIYLEVLKPVMTATGEEAEKKKRSSQLVLYTCLEQALRLFHPSMPFITEELWQRLPGRNLLPKERESIMINAYPKPQAEWDNQTVEKQMEFIMKIVKAVRFTKSNYNLTYKQKPNVFIKTTAEQAEIVRQQTLDIQTLTACGDLTVVLDASSIPLGCAVEVVSENTESHTLLIGLIDFKEEIKKLQKQETEKQNVLNNTIKKTQMPNYAEKVPKQVQEETAQKIETYKAELEKIQSGIKTLNLFVSSSQ